MSPVPGLPPPPQWYGPPHGRGGVQARIYKGFGSISDYQPRICWAFAAFLTTSLIFTRCMLPFKRPT